MRFVILSTMVTAGLACTELPPQETEERALQGLVVVERSEGDEASVASVSAKFIRFLASDRAASETLVGARSVMPNLSECLSEQELSHLESVARPRVGVELVDVGDVTLSAFGGLAPAEELVLVPRAFPDVGDLASGVFYTSSDTTESLPAPATYMFSGSGTVVMDAFKIEAVAPKMISGLAIQGRQVTDLGSAALSLDSEVTLTWLANDEPDSRVYLEVRGGVASWCSLPDSGHAVVPAKYFQGKSDVFLSLHRVVERTLVVDFTDQVEKSQVTVRFDFARHARLQLSPGG